MCNVRLTEASICLWHTLITFCSRYIYRMMLLINNNKMIRTGSFESFNEFFIFDARIKTKKNDSKLEVSWGLMVNAKICMLKTTDDNWNLRPNNYEDGNYYREFNALLWRQWSMRRRRDPFKWEFCGMKLWKFHICNRNCANDESPDIINYYLFSIDAQLLCFVYCIHITWIAYTWCLHCSHECE